MSGKGGNLSSHKSLDLNPIEMAFSNPKALLRKAAARTYDDQWRVVGHVCDLFTEEECYNFFNAARYATLARTFGGGTITI